MFKPLLIVVLLSTPLLTQARVGVWAGGADPPAQASPSVPRSDDMAQLRQDLDRLDSLLSNMSSETEFLRDQNLQILLRTNSQMWTILIRDMRRQLAREKGQQVGENGKGRTTSPGAPGSLPKK